MAAQKQARAIENGGSQVAVVLGSMRSWFDLVHISDFKLRWDAIIIYKGPRTLLGKSNLLTSHNRIAVLEVLKGHDDVAIITIKDSSTGFNRHAFAQITGSHLSVMEISASRKLHPHAKPVKAILPWLFAFRDKVVWEPFAGSGTLFICAEKLNKTCIGMESNPAYCDVIIKRFEDYTGQKAKLLT